MSRDALFQVGMNPAGPDVALTEENTLRLRSAASRNGAPQPVRLSRHVFGAAHRVRATSRDRGNSAQALTTAA